MPFPLYQNAHGQAWNLHARSAIFLMQGELAMPLATFAEKVIAFNKSLNFTGKLPQGIGVMNPFRENACAMPAMEAFYGKYYNDREARRIILGINPGRFGAGITGVPFTDPKRLAEVCGIHIDACKPAHEPSSQFVYEVIAAMGGAEKFYGEWYINSICPLGFVRVGANGRNVNYNYYDNAALQKAALPFILKTLPEQLALGIDAQTCICLGTGKNAAFLQKLNKTYKFFEQIIALDHPRYVMQYKSKEKAAYVRKYVDALTQAAKA